MRNYGLIGYPLSHSFSGNYFTKKFKDEGIEDAHYELFELKKASNFPDFLRNHPQLNGLNVTIPHKVDLMEHLDEIDADAKAVGAVNTIAFNDDKLIGYNTDIIGFKDSLQPLLKAHHTSAIILGTGGASKAVKYVLDELGIASILISRHAEKSTHTYANFQKEWIYDHKLIINTTPVGTYPDILAHPDIPVAHVDEQHLVYDLIYNPKMSAFLQHAKIQGAETKNGLEMLERQAEASWEIWNT